MLIKESRIINANYETFYDISTSNVITPRFVIGSCQMFVKLCNPFFFYILQSIILQNQSFATFMIPIINLIIIFNLSLITFFTSDVMFPEKQISFR